jgi:ParB family chromosome partitioning protein
MAPNATVDRGFVKRRGGLGRGLDALLPSQTPGEEADGSTLRHVPLDSIATNPRQPRTSFDEGSIDELATSIRELGVLQPLLVRSATDEGYELIAGERRLRAAERAGLTEVPVVVVETDDRGSLERALVENVHREDLNPIEEAAAYKQLLEEGALTQQKLGDRLGRNRVTISNGLRLLDLPTPVQRLLVERRITAAHGRALLALENSPFMGRLARRVAEEGLSVRDTEELVRKYQTMASGGQSATASAHPHNAQLVEAQRLLTDHLQTRVRVDQSKRKGKIVVDFSSPDELARLTSLILGSDPTTASTTSPE